MTFFRPTKNYSMILWNWCSHFLLQIPDLGKVTWGKTFFVFMHLSIIGVKLHIGHYTQNFFWNFSKAVTWSPPIKQWLLLLLWKCELMTLTPPETFTYMKPWQNIGIWQAQPILELLDPGFHWIKFQNYESLSLFQPNFKYSL